MKKQDKLHVYKESQLMWDYGIKDTKPMSYYP